MRRGFSPWWWARAPRCHQLELALKGAKTCIKRMWCCKRTVIWDLRWSSVHLLSTRFKLIRYEAPARMIVWPRVEEEPLSTHEGPSSNQANLQAKSICVVDAFASTPENGAPKLSAAIYPPGESTRTRGLLRAGRRRSRRTKPLP